MPATLPAGGLSAVPAAVPAALPAAAPAPKVKEAAAPKAAAAPAGAALALPGAAGIDNTSTGVAAAPAAGLLPTAPGYAPGYAPGGHSTLPMPLLNSTDEI